MNDMHQPRQDGPRASDAAAAQPGAGTRPPTVLERLALIEQRMSRLEASIGTLRPAVHDGTDTDSEKVAAVETQSPVPPPVSATPPTTPTLPAAPVLPAAPLLPVLPPRRDRSGVESASGGTDLERLIGGRWYALLGALVVIIGIGLFVRFAWQQGWVKEIPGGVRCLMAALLGVALLGAAEWARRRVNAWAAVGLNAAGLGAIYVAAYAAYALYRLFTPELAGALLVGCMVLGVVIGVRGRLVAVAAVALLGGYLAPLLVSTQIDRLWILPPYWLMLLSTGLVLAGWQGGWFVVLRWLTWSLTVLLGFGWTILAGDDHPFLGVVFLGLTWAMTHTELWWSAAQRDHDRRRASSPERQERAGPAARAEAGITETSAATRSVGAIAAGERASSFRVAVNPWQTWAPMLSSFVISIWAVGLGIVIARISGALPQWLPAAAGAGAALFVAFPLVGHLRVLRDPPESDAERLGAGLWLQAAACIIAAIALGISGSAQMLAWVAMGTAAVAAGRWAAAHPVVAFGVLVLLIAVVRLLSWEMVFSGARTGGFELLWLHWTTWSALALITTAGLSASAWMLVRDWSGAGDSVEDPAPVNEAAARERAVASLARRGPQWQPVGVALTAIAVLLMMLTLAHEESVGLAILIAWSLLAGLLGALHRFAPPLRPFCIDFMALAVVGASVIGWMGYFAFAWDRFEDPAVLHRGLLLAVLLAAEVLWLVHVTRGLWSGPSRHAVGLGISIGVLFLASSLEVARVAGLIAEESTVRGAAVSVWWGLVAVGCLVLGFRRRLAWARRLGLGLLGVATLKALIVDTASVSTGWRAVTLVGLGLLMLAVGVVYSRLSKRES